MGRLGEACYKPGDVVLVRQGKFNHLPFAVVGCEQDRVLIADGANYSAVKPKKKNVIHLQRTHFYLEDVAQYVAEGRLLDNGWLIQKLRGASSMKGEKISG